MIEAKPVSNRFWILKDNNKKIGEVNISNVGYEVGVNGVKTSFKTLESLKMATGIKFTKITNDKRNNDNDSHGFPHDGEKFNEMWDINLKLPLFTKKDDSKSWFVAGYFKVKIKGKWRDILAPKLLILQRNEYKGPYKTLKNTNDDTKVKTIKTIKSAFKINSPLSVWFN